MTRFTSRTSGPCSDTDGLHSSSSNSRERFRLNPAESPNTTFVPIAPPPIRLPSGIVPVAMNCWARPRQLKPIANLGPHLQDHLISLVTPPHGSQRIPNSLVMHPLRCAHDKRIHHALIGQWRDTNGSGHLRRQLNRLEMHQVFVEDAEEAVLSEWLRQDVVHPTLKIRVDVLCDCQWCRLSTTHVAQRSRSSR